VRHTQQRFSTAASYYHQDVDKTVGCRRTDEHDAEALQRTMAAVHRTGSLVPRGVSRFSSFENSDAWMTRMMAPTHVSHNQFGLTDMASAPSTFRVFTLGQKRLVAATPQRCRL
jgi:hypothetical protein